MAHDEELKDFLFGFAREIVLEPAQRFAKDERSIRGRPSKAAQSGSNAIRFRQVA
jgi:hypothetical protein